eukprot:bmy_09130T0
MLQPGPITAASANAPSHLTLLRAAPPFRFPGMLWADSRRPSWLWADGREVAPAPRPALWRSRCVLEAGGASAAEMTQAEKGDTENGKEKGGEKEKEQRGVKRPIVPALVPESLQEVRRRGRALDSASGRGGGPRSWARGGGWRTAGVFGRPPRLLPDQQIQSNFIVVIHPGSTTLRIGRATDTLPASIPHVIARRHKQQGQPLLCLAYGGSDVSRCFYWLMQRAGFPYRECQLTNKMDCLLLQHLKETFCHLDQDISGLQDHEFQIRHPDSPALLYQFRLGDEKLQAPMALFYPATFGIVGQKMTTLQHRSQGDPEDPHDEHYLLATQSKQEQSAKATADRKSASKPIGFEGDLRGQSSDLPERLHSQEVDLGSSQGDCLMAGNDSEEALTALMSRKTAISLILNKMPPSFRRIIENVDVITRPKDMDPRLIAWKGGAVLACLDTTQELWIYQREWQRFGVRMLRERAAFVW